MIKCPACGYENCDTCGEYDGNCIVCNANLDQWKKDNQEEKEEEIE